METKYPLIKAVNIAKRYKLGASIVSALDGVSLEISEGEFVAIVGKSGSGKSTLMHILGLLSKPSEGELFFDNTSISDLDDTALARIRRDKIGFIFQSFNLLARTSSLENVLLPITYTRKPNDHHRAVELLTRVGLQDRMESMPSQLSGGQQQRVAIARALINDPSVVLADEPTGNLDTKSGEDVLNLLRELNAEGKTMIIVTHDEDIANFAQRLIRISDGKIIEDRRR
jgi:putative ABC transport system ATP-binding protein